MCTFRKEEKKGEEGDFSGEFLTMLAEEEITLKVTCYTTGKKKGIDVLFFSLENPSFSRIKEGGAIKYPDGGS